MSRQNQEYHRHSPHVKLAKSCVNVGETANALADLCHCVVVQLVWDGDRWRKPPVRAGWQKTPATPEEVQAALDDPELAVAIMPGRSGLLIVDVDADKQQPVGVLVEQVEESLGPPICVIVTPSGGRHLLYRCDQLVPDSSWDGGEIRCESGYVGQWQPDATLAALEGLHEHESVNTDLWPLSEPQRAVRRHRGPQKRASRRSDSLEKGLRLALDKIPCWRLTYDEWLSIGFGLHHAEGIGLIEDGLRLWIQHSKTDWRRYREGECSAKWRGFDVYGGITYRRVFSVANRFGYRPSRYRRRTPIHKWGDSDDPDLNGRQERELNFLYGRVKQERASRKDGLLVQVRQGDVAHLMDCNIKTVRRDFAHLRNVRRIREVGKATVRHETGGHVETVYELLPVSRRHQKPDGQISDAEQAAWDAIMQATRQQDVEMHTPFGVLVTIGGKLHKVLLDVLTGGRPLLVPLEQERAPPSPD